MNTGETSHLHNPFGGSGRRSPIDTFEQHRELSTAQRDGSARRVRPYNTTAFKTLRKQAEAIPIEPENLHNVASASAKDEDMT